MQILKVKSNEEGQRIDKYLRKYLSDAPLSYIYKLFRKKDVKVNGKPTSIDYKIKKDDEIMIYISDQVLNEFNTPKVISNSYNNLDIIYEDDNLLIINKEAGIIVHEGEDNKKTNTLNNDILNYLKNKGEYKETDLYVPSCVHRLDRNTSGIIIAAKTLKASTLLLELFKDKVKLQKQYLALVVGKAPAKLNINKPLFKDSKNKLVHVDFKKGLEAITEFETLVTNNKYSLLKVNILTGRTHQIRVHLASEGYPIINDDKYGNFKENKLFSGKFNYKYQFLHSYKIKFNKIEGNLSYLSNKEFVAPLKKEESSILEKLFPNFKL